MKYRRMFLRVVRYFDEPAGLVKIQTTSIQLDNTVMSSTFLWYCLLCYTKLFSLDLELMDEST